MLKVNDTVYYTQIGSIYQHLIKGTIVWLGEDSYSSLALIVTTQDGRTRHDKVELKNISDDTGAREQWLKQNEVYEQEALVNEELQKLEDMRKELRC